MAGISFLAIFLEKTRIYFYLYLLNLIRGLLGSGVAINNLLNLQWKE